MKSKHRLAALSYRMDNRPTARHRQLLDAPKYRVFVHTLQQLDSLGMSSFQGDGKLDYAYGCRAAECLLCGCCSCWFVSWFCLVCHSLPPAG